MPSEDSSKAQVQLKQRAGRKYGEFRDETIQRIVSDEKEIELDEWYSLVDKMMSRPEIVQAFLEILDYCKDHPNNVLPPGQSRTFKRLFLIHASSDNKYLLLEKLRDPILYMETTTAHRRATVRSISSLEDAF